MKNNSKTVQSLWVGLSSLVTFGFAIVSSMILSRYFPKEDYGTYKQVMYVYTTLLTVFTLGLPKAFSYFLPRVSKEEGRDVVNKITNLFFLLGGVFSLILFFFSPLIAQVLKNEQLVDAIRIFSPVPFLILPTMGLESIYASYRETRVIPIYTVITRTIMLMCVALPCIIFNGGYKMALYGFLTSSAFSFFIALYLKNRPFRGVGNSKSNVKYREIFNFSLPLLYASLWGMLISSADQFFISRYFGTDVFADFSNGSMEIPFVGMIIGACSTVLFPLFSKMCKENSDPVTTIQPVWDSVFKKTVMLTYPLVVFCFFFAEPLMVFLYGEAYAASADFFRIKIIINLFTLIAYAPVILALGKTKMYANVHIVHALVLLALDYLIVTFFDNPILILCASVICRIGCIFYMLHFVSKLFRTSIIRLFPIKLIFKIIIPSAIFLFGYTNIITNTNNFIYLLFGALSYFIFYLIWSYLMKLDYLLIIKPLLPKK